MRKFIRHYAAVIAIYVVGVTACEAAGGTFTRGCAARDMQIMMLIEGSPISIRHKDDAVRTIMHARIMCFEGHVFDALALYDNIARSVTWSLSSEGP